MVQGLGAKICLLHATLQYQVYVDQYYCINNNERRSQHYDSHFLTGIECYSHACKYFSNIPLFHTCELNMCLHADSTMIRFF